MISVGLGHFLTLGAILFSLGIIAVLTKRNAVGVLIGIELMLNAACINFISFSYFNGRPIDGAVFVLFVIVMAAAEAVVALALLLAMQRRLKTVDIDVTNTLKG